MFPGQIPLSKGPSCPAAGARWMLLIPSPSMRAADFQKSSLSDMERALYACRPLPREYQALATRGGLSAGAVC
jgi:hypothetical protein